MEEEGDGDDDDEEWLPTTRQLHLPRGRLPYLYSGFPPVCSHGRAFLTLPSVFASAADQKPALHAHIGEQPWLVDSQGRGATNVKVSDKPRKMTIYQMVRTL